MVSSFFTESHFKITMPSLDILTHLLQDIRFQVLVGIFGLILWFFRPQVRRKDICNKTVFITGCDSGMGHRMARRFDEMGMHVYAGCLQPTSEGAIELKNICSDRFHIVPIDITNDEQVKEAVAYVEANLPQGEKGLYCLVNNAGVMAYTDFELMTTKMCEEIINTNLTGSIRVTKHFLPLLYRTPGRIVTITSIVARLSLPRLAVYAATKYGLNGFFSTLRHELSDKGVHVAIVEPGDFSTTTHIMKWTQNHLDEMWQSLSSEEQKSKLHLFEKTKQKVNKTPSSPAEQERNYRFLLQNVEDAMTSQEPQWRYVSAPRATRLALGVLRSLPEKWTFRVFKEK